MYNIIFQAATRRLGLVKCLELEVWNNWQGRKIGLEICSIIYSGEKMHSESIPCNIEVDLLIYCAIQQ